MDFGCQLFSMMNQENISSERQLLAGHNIVKCENWDVYGGGVLNFELDTDVRPEVSTTTL